MTTKQIDYCIEDLKQAAEQGQNFSAEHLKNKKARENNTEHPRYSPGSVFRSDFVRLCENKSKSFGHGKSPETLNFRAFLSIFVSISALAELRSTTSALQTVLS